MQKPRAALIPFLVVLAVLLLADAPAAAAPLPPAPWQLTDPLPLATSHSASVQLPDGDVLVVGGGTGATYAVAGSMRYDAASATWMTVQPLPFASRLPAAVTLADGRVLVAGGLGADPMGGFTRVDAAIFDPQTNGWTTVAPMSTARFGHTLTLLADGTVLAAGGSGGGYLDSAERYDPVADTWTAVASMPSPHSEHTATRLADGSVVVIGGIEAPDAPFGRATAAAARFDPASGAWSASAPLPQPRFRHVTTLLPDGALVVAGGTDNSSNPRSTILRDPVDGAWRQFAGIIYDRPVVAQIGDGLLLLAQGGESTLLDMRDGQSARAGTAPVFRVGGSLYPLPGGDLLRVGGEVSQSFVDRFTPRAHATTSPADFGEQTSGRRSATVTIPVTTAGDVPLFVRGIAIEGASAGEFAVTSDSCTDAVLERGESCFVGVRFTPAADGRRTATLAVSAPLLDDGRALIELSGDGIAAPVAAQPPAPPASAQPPAPPAGGGSAPPPVARRAAVEPKLRCGARTGRRVVCTGVPRSLGSGKVRLSRSGIVHATGTLKDGRLTLTVRRKLFDRRYTLVVAGRRAVKVVLD